MLFWLLALDIRFVQIIESYYGKHATAQELATRLGG